MKICEIITEDVEILNERAPKRVKVVRKGKVVKKLKCGPGYSIKGRRCVKQTSAQKITRRRAAKKGARKGKAARIRTRKRSIRVRRQRRL